MVKKKRSPVAVKRATPSLPPVPAVDSPSRSSRRHRSNLPMKPREISGKDIGSKDCDDQMHPCMEEILAEPKIFSGLPAWFSSSVSQNRKNLWVDNGGRITDFDEASFVFSEDRNADDTKVLYKTDKFLSETLAVFHAMYIDDCISAGQMKSISIGPYMLPPDEVYKSLKEKLKSTETICCQFKWEAVDCAACSLSLNSTTGNKTTICTERSSSRHDLSGYTDINSLPEPNYDDVEEFVVGVNNAEIFPKEL